MNDLVLETPVRTDLDGEAREALLAGAEYISENGHYKNAFFRPAGVPFEQAIEEGLPACALGGIMSYTGHMDEIWLRARQLLQEHLGCSDAYSIGDWNDDDDRTAEEVILEMKRVAHDG